MTVAASLARFLRIVIDFIILYRQAVPVGVLVNLSTHIKVRVSQQIISSPEPLGSQGELIGWP